MYKSSILSLLLILSLSRAAISREVQKDDLLISITSMDHVSNPNEWERWWKRVFNTQEARGIGDAISTYYGCVGCYTLTADGIDHVVHFSNGPQDFTGAVQAPVNYTVCRAYVQNPSLNCNGTLTGSYRKADDPQSAHIDGLHWYIVVPTAGIGGGSCWVDGTLVVEFAKAASDNPLLQYCHKSGELAFHYGK